MVNEMNRLASGATRAVVRRITKFRLTLTYGKPVNECVPEKTSIESVRLLDGRITCIVA